MFSKQRSFVVLVLTLCPRGLCYEIEITVGGVPRKLHFDAEDAFDDIATRFVEEHELRGGEGCSTGSCVASMLVTAMRQHVGDCAGSIAVDGSPCFNRVSIAGTVYRKQGAAEVKRQKLLLQRSEDVATRGRRRERTARAPCVPPYCEVECATVNADEEAQLAADFIADDPELSALTASDPEPRRCPGGRIFPIFIGIPATEVVSCVPRKYRGLHDSVRDLATPGEYVFGPSEEAEYKRAYREAYFGITKRKAGWDCLRHYEIVASGSLPLFDGNLDDCPSKTLAHWPKQLLKRLSQLHGVVAVETGRISVDATILDAGGEYAAAAAGLLAFARARLTTDALADYVLRATGHVNATNVLFLSSHPSPDYMRDMLLHGLRMRLGRGLVDFIRPAYMYAPASGADPAPRNVSAHATLYGHGFTYAHRLRDDAHHFVDRSRIEHRIRDHEFDVVVYGSVHRGMPFWPEVQATYSPNDLIFVDGEDEHGWCPWSAFDEFMEAWGEWRESHEGRMDKFRLMLRVCGEVERQLRLRLAHVQEVRPKGPRVVTDVARPGASISKWIPGLPRGKANYQGNEEARSSADLESASACLNEAMDFATEARKKLEGALGRGRETCESDDDRESRGPLGFEVSAADYVCYMVQMLGMVDAEFDAQRNLADELAERRDNASRAGFRRLEGLLSIVEVQPHVITETVDEIARIVATSDAIAADRATQQQQGTSPTPSQKKKPRRRRKKKSSSGTPQADVAADEEEEEPPPADSLPRS
ncbi:hypothetical protein CTAYLR_009722 [Chrysophaeum taylorii]|uniref:Uncharacterized protein n=1 Tax=Chrysophaeum taylorii TaxID=2483200 RepID=A0AAD7XJ55_9STRA|nr:hypothetical protein CTAYLR_009722 [Chrysophaeum taylorii]